MKITLVGTLPPIKALSPYCFHLAEALSKKVDLEFIDFKSILPDFLYSGGVKDEKEISYNIQNIEINRILNWYNPYSWIKASLEVKGDIIHAQHWALYSSAMYCIILPIVKLKRKKIVLSVHNITPHVTDRFTILVDKIINNIVFPFADAFIVHNQRNKEKLVELYGIDETKISVIGHGTLKPYNPLRNISKKKAREHLKIPTNKKVILFFGYIWGYKGLDVFLKSLTLIKESINNVSLIVAGQALKDWKKYEKIIQKNELDKHVIKKLEYITDSDIEYYFSCADLVVLPYKQHPFDTHGGVGALAIYFKKPLVVTNVGGLPEYVKDKQVVANPCDVEDLSRKIIHVLSDEMILKKLSKDSEELSQELSWENIADKTIGTYKRIQKYK